MSDNKNLMGTKDAVFMAVAAVLALRSVPMVAGYGPSAIAIWIIAALFMILPLSMVCGELATGWPHDGGIFVWVKEAFGARVGWVSTVCFLFSCVVFFPLMLQFGFAAVSGNIMSAKIADNKVFVGVGSAVIFWILTLINMRGLKFTNIVNSLSVYLGIFIPSAVIAVIAIYWVISGHPMQTDYVSQSASFIPDFSKLSNIVLASSAMFAFAGLEVTGMVAGRMKNPQRDFPRSMIIASILIVGIYILATIAINTIYPASKLNVVSGISQSIEFASNTLGMPWLSDVIGGCLFFGAVGQINSWLVGPIYMFQEAATEAKILKPNSMVVKMHPVHDTPHIAMIVQAILVTVMCFSSFLSDSLEGAYWILSAMTTVCYFIPYLLLFSAYIVLRKTRMDVHRAFKIPGNIAPYVIAMMGLVSILFAIAILFIPPDGIAPGNFWLDKAQIFGGAIVAIIFALVLYSRGQKRNHAEV
ncbi:amino acid transporter [Photobacterium kishitanii]|uniref:Amino acid permease n=1 Tax=Photobacterium kishitanii TaxID=318456 RepID=A0AAX0YWE9_9GAMM|nr:APC family permease [Photobacterium kishitanii]KJG57258.1 amino acid transporter [Photobacterium kishitanii]KJG60675.1 amino acid transporter [Photobacterium kishitanii]KJG64993.1 amino acid transporter [Photobacterium kishitanii]KJG69048.1 amino acid transporter [Photobacterium kishitanii]OBU29655.1 amino acid transporter [Photobacterium kishitanii]